MMVAHHSGFSLKTSNERCFCNMFIDTRISNFNYPSSCLTFEQNLIFSSIDFCDSLYYNLPHRDLRTMQLFITSAARCSLYSRERVTPLCIDLHFLPGEARIHYKICLLAHKAIHTGEPKYLADLLNFCEFSTSRLTRGLRMKLIGHLPSRLVSVNRTIAF